MPDKVLTFDVDVTSKGDLMNMSFTLLDISTKDVIDKTIFIIIPQHRRVNDKISVAKDYQWAGEISKDEEDDLNVIQNLPPTAHTHRVSRFIAPTNIRGYYDEICQKHTPIVAASNDSRIILDSLFRGGRHATTEYQMGKDALLDQGFVFEYMSMMIYDHYIHNDDRVYDILDTDHDRATQIALIVAELLSRPHLSAD